MRHHHVQFVMFKCPTVQLHRKNTGSKSAATATTTSETAASSTSTIGEAHNEKDDDSMQRLKRKLSEIDQEPIQFKTQQQNVEDDFSTLTQSMTQMGNEILTIRQDMVKLNQQLYEITTLLKQNIGQEGKIREPTIKSPTRKRRGKKDTNSFSSNEERSGSWASDCDSEEEKRRRHAKGVAGIEDMVVESVILGNMLHQHIEIGGWGARETRTFDTGPGGATNIK
jgi:chromosome segregation ATPase